MIQRAEPVVVTLLIAGAVQIRQHCKRNKKAGPINLNALPLGRSFSLSTSSSSSEEISSSMQKEILSEGISVWLHWEIVAMQGSKQQKFL